MLDRPRHVALGWLARLVCDRPGWILFVAGALAVAAIVYAATALTFQADRNALISEDLPWNQRYIEYREDFAGYDSIAVVVEVPEGEDGRQRAQRFVRRVAERLEQQQRGIQQVWWGFDPSEASPAMMRLLPMPRFRRRMEQIKQAAPMVRAEGVGDLLDSIAEKFSGGRQQQADPGTAAQQMRQLSGLIGRMESILRGEAGAEHLGQMELPGASDWRYLSSDDDELLLIEIVGEPVEGAMYPLKPAVEAAQRATEAVGGKMPGVDAGVTGIPVIEAEETRISTRDSTFCSLLAVAAIAVLLIGTFGGWKFPLLMVASLGLGVAWSFGFLTLAIGHLQVLSVVFTVILLGLGIDFGIHLVSRFEQVRWKHPEGVDGFRGAIGETLQSAGPGVLTGAVTTSIAFGTTLLTDFKGMAEMGLIAAVGVILCMIAMLTVLPAAMRLLRTRRRHVRHAATNSFGMSRRGVVMPMVRHPVVTMVAAGAVVALAAVAMSRVRYDNNLMNLLPKGLPSVQWQQKYMKHSDTAVWYGVSITDNLKTAEKRTARFREKDSVAGIGGIGRLFPKDEKEKLAMIRDVRRKFGSAMPPPSPNEGGASERGSVVVPASETIRRPLQRINAMLGGAGLLGGAVKWLGGEPDPRVQRAMDGLQENVQGALAAMDDSVPRQQQTQRRRALQRGFLQLRGRLRRRVREALSTDQLRPADMPGILCRQTVSQTEPTRYQIKVYPKQNVWAPAKMRPFIRQTRRVDPELTGSPVQIYESGLLMQRSYKFAGALALMVVFALAYLDFLRLADAALCLLPVASAFVTAFGLMWLFGFELNPANIIVLPLLFGIGVAAGVHIMHRYRQHPMNRPPGLTAGTGKGIILTSSTTVIAFASMLLATHRGIRSLGFLLSVGILLTLVACLTLMPAVLELRNRYRAYRRLRRRANRSLPG